MREPTVRQGKSAIFWVVLAVVGSCGVCSMLTFALIGFGLFTADAASGPVAVSVPVATTTALPTGNTPDLFPGMPGWLPSGQGVPIPTAEEVDGEPRGLWWYSELRSNDQVGAAVMLFLAGGTQASHPRPGGGRLFDLEGQRAQKGDTGLGTFSVEDGVIRQQHNNFKSKVALSFESDEGGPYMMIGQTKFWPLSPPFRAGLVGTWRTAGGKYVFRDDGTFESGMVDLNGAYTLAVGGAGRWLLDGYLLQLAPNGAPGWITTIGATGNHFLVIGSNLYDRE